MKKSSARAARAGWVDYVQKKCYPCGMQETIAAEPKQYFYFDESGSPAILGHHGRNLLQGGLTSRTFSVGYVQTANPHELLVNLERLRHELMEDEYLKAIPSMRNLKNGFHANKDCSEVREKVFKLLKKADFSAYIIVARKSEEVFRKKFNMSTKRLYKFLVAELLKNRIGSREDIDIYFSEMGNTLSIQNMTDAIERLFPAQANGRTIRIFLQQPSHLPLLQVADYMLWAVFRAFEHNEFRYFDFVREKIKVVHDIFDTRGNQFSGTLYTDSNPLDAKKLSPISG